MQRPKVKPFLSTVHSVRDGSRQRAIYHSCESRRGHAASDAHRLAHNTPGHIRCLAGTLIGSRHICHRTCISHEGWPLGEECLRIAEDGLVVIISHPGGPEPTTRPRVWRGQDKVLHICAPVVVHRWVEGI
ncbi:hypothetical protein BDP81DRAFT_19412 [Colletotrichum phormii]|uniref:Uncharacterized protein n=1 Tax=Colletotrichum phormii TaxID=359342 RepID=A0AAJ0EPB4_9PEZI|nr:uncharacterized protein BDP81DRAFT_19412 [Colletotrichum phormii]KAK1656298.1 hypothetical protein BDP81DRAFT_19412 [Colletotrichum phormii]